MPRKKESEKRERLEKEVKIRDIYERIQKKERMTKHDVKTD